MNDHLKQFATHSAYEAVKNNLDTPNVVLCTQEDEVHYNPYVDPCQQYDYVEIAGIKWATKNVGACDVTDPGLYFQWGVTTGHTLSELDQENPIIYWNEEIQEVYDRHFSGEEFLLELLPNEDMASTNINSNWKVPSIEDFDSLIDNTNQTYTSNYQNSGVAGWIFVDKLDSSKVLFFPEVGTIDTGDFYHSNYTNYWANKVTGDTEFTVFTLRFSSSQIYDIYSNGVGMEYGAVVRAIVDEE